MNKANDNIGYEVDTPVTEEELRQELLFNENDILKALTEQNQYGGRTEIIMVDFGNIKFKFRIRPLTEREWERCRERNTRYQKNRRLGGMRVPESSDTVSYHSDLIYTATVDEDKAKIWNNKNLWAAVGAVTGTDMIDKLIPLAGKKQAIVNRIEILSGFDDDEENDYGETIKN